MEITIVKDKTYPLMYRLRWPDKVLSFDMYNITRAREHSKRFELNITEPMSDPKTDKN